MVKKICLKFLLVFVNWKNNKWLSYSIFVTTIGAIYSLLLSCFGSYLGLKDDNNITAFGIFITIIVCILSFINIIVERYEKYNDKDTNELIKLNATADLLFKILYSVDTICKKKLYTQLKTIELLKKNTFKEPPEIYSEPCFQLNTINNELATSLSFLLNNNYHRLETKDIYIGLAYNFALENENVWKWAESDNERGLRVTELVRNSNSTFNEVLNSNVLRSTGILPCAFHNSKQKAFVSGHYVIDKDNDIKDENDELSGSIACYKIIIKKSDVEYIRAILCISTFSKKFDVDLSEEDLQNRDHPLRLNFDTIVEKYIQRIKIELCNYYIQFLREQYKKKSTV